MVRDPYRPKRTTINLHDRIDDSKILTQEEKRKKKEEYALQDALLGGQIAASEKRIAQLERDRLAASGRLYNGTEHSRVWNLLEEENRKLQQLKEIRYSNEMEYNKEIAEGLYLRGVGSVWGVVQQEQAVKDRIAANRQALAYMSADDPRRKTLEHEIQQDLARLNGAKEIALDYGINYNDLVDYARRLEDAEKTQQSQQKWQDMVRENDRMMNAANWLSVPMNVAGEVTGKIADGVQAVKNSLSGEYRPVNKNSNLYYGSNMSNAIRETTRDVIHERLGDGVGGYVGEFVYDVSMGLLDSALEWGVGQIIAGSNLLPDNTKDFLEKVEQASGFVENNAELMQTYREELEDGKSPAEAFGECVKILVAEGIWNGIEKKLEGNRVVADALNSEDVNSVGNMGMVVYQSWPEDAFLDGFYADGTPGAAKRTATATGQGKISKPVFENVVWQEVRHPAYEKNKYVLERDSQANKVYWKMGKSVYNDVHQRKLVRNRR